MKKFFTHLRTRVRYRLKRISRKLRFLFWEVGSPFRKSMKSMTVSTQQGTFTILTEDEFIGKSLYCNGHFELDFMLNAMTFLRSIQKCPPKGKGTILDVGANIGITSVGMLHTGEMEKAIAIEPEPRNFSLLQRNVLLNGLTEKVVCLPFAASHEKGKVSFELSENNGGDHRVRMDSHSIDSDSVELYHESARRFITVQSDTLENLLANLPQSFTQDIALFWIDVQGYEGYAFMGAKSVLSKRIPVVSEIWPYAIKRAGMTQEQFCNIAKSIWSDYWVWRRSKFVRYPIDTLYILFDELGCDEQQDNVIFTP